MFGCLYRLWTVGLGSLGTFFFFASFSDSGTELVEGRWVYFAGAVLGWILFALRQYANIFNAIGVIAGVYTFLGIVGAIFDTGTKMRLTTWLLFCAVLIAGMFLGSWYNRRRRLHGPSRRQPCRHHVPHAQYGPCPNCGSW